MKALFDFINYLSTARFTDRQSLDAILASIMLNPQSYYDEEIPTYAEDSQSIAAELSARMDEKQPVNLTTEMDSSDLTKDSLAYHRVFGSIIADDRYSWYFSTKRFMANFKKAEENPLINAHFMHVSSGGGEAWLLDKAFELIQNATKPVFAYYEKAACSAGYYLMAPAKKIAAYTQNCTAGSIGTMIYMINILPALIKQGVQEIEEYATKSDLKNKKFNDLLKGNAENYIKSELDPLQEQFESNVRSARPVIAKLPDDHPVVRGETYSTALAIENGLTDAMMNIEDAIAEAYQMGMDWKRKQQAQQRAISYL